MGDKKAGILALALLVLGWLAAYVAPSFDVMLIGRLIIGMGGITMGVMGAAAVVQWFNPKNLMFPMGLWAAGLPLGIAWGEVLAGVVISSFAWRASMLTGLIISVICLVIVATVIKSGPFSSGAKPAEKSKKAPAKNGGAWSVFKNIEVWKFNFALFLGFIPFMAVTTYWVTWLMVNKAISSVVVASSITSVVGIAGIFGAIAAGYIAAMIRRSKPMYVIPAIIFGLALLGFVWAQGIAIIVLLSLVVGLASYMLATMMFAIPPQLVLPKLTGTALGVAVVFFNLAGVFGPIIIGDAYASSETLLIPGVIMFVCLVAAAILAQSMKIK